MQVVDETTPIRSGLMALSCFGFGGANFHMVVKGDAAQRVQLLQSDGSSSDGSIPEEPAPTDSIVPLAARTAEGLAYLAKVVTEVRTYPPLKACKVRIFGYIGYLVIQLQKTGPVVHTPMNSTFSIAQHVKRLTVTRRHMR